MAEKHGSQWSECLHTPQESFFCFIFWFLLQEQSFVLEKHDCDMEHKWQSPAAISSLNPPPPPRTLYDLLRLLVRVGRTARAGCRGTAVTIAKKGQVKQFLKMRTGVDEKRVRLDASPADQSRLLLLAGRYQRCLKDLKEVLEAERTGELDPTAPVTAVDNA